MAKSVNKVILVGNVGQDPEVKYSQSGIPVAKFSLATNERFKDRNDHGKTGQNGTTLWPGSVWRRSLASTCQRLEGVRRRQAADHKLGRPAERREEIPHRNRRPRPGPARPAGKRGGDHQRPTHNENQDQPSHAGSGEIVDDDIPF